MCTDRYGLTTKLSTAKEHLWTIRVRSAVLDDVPTQVRKGAAQSIRAKRKAAFFALAGSTESPKCWESGIQIEGAF